MYKPSDLSKVVTIMGLVVEGIAIIVFAILALVMNQIINMPIDTILHDEIDPNVAAYLLTVFQVFSVIFVVIGVLLLIAFMVNLVLFTKMIVGKFDEAAAKRVYLYQAIWGGISLLFNTITGVLYIISAVKGFSRPREKNPREGI